MPGPTGPRSPTPAGVKDPRSPKPKHKPPKPTEKDRSSWWFNKIGIQTPILRGFAFGAQTDAPDNDLHWNRLADVDQVILACRMDLDPATDPWDPCIRERFASRLSVYFRAAICALDRPLGPLLYEGVRNMEMVCRVGLGLGLELIGGAPQAEAYLAMMVLQRYSDAYARFQRVQATLSPQERQRCNQEFDLLCRFRGYPGYFIAETPCRCPQLYVAGHKADANQPVLMDLAARWIARIKAADRTVAAA